ncbi:hypothetical protein Bca52824_015314 [Brassica carinata]|uniref:Uncharacterized protein n=1 Tax=Brassica carinata TaxID=52824 RepID=A0A8X7W1W6_BRACI|nr:hypothetical protein Bca52824_015314 [Brassica carinata]
MRLKEEPPLSSPDTTTRGSSRDIESHGFERWRRGGVTTNQRRHIDMFQNFLLKTYSTSLKSSKPLAKKDPSKTQ